MASEERISRGRARVRTYRDPLATAREWRELAAAGKWSIRDLVIETGNRQNFIGSPKTVARTINDFVQADASDRFILVPHITPATTWAWPAPAGSAATSARRREWRGREHVALPRRRRTPGRFPRPRRRTVDCRIRARQRFRAVTST